MFLVAEINNAIAGYINSWFIAKEIQINSFAVGSQFKRLKTGTRLLETTIKKCHSAEIITLEVRSSNMEARKFYSNSGFIETGKRKNYYGNDDAILMEKRI